MSRMNLAWLFVVPLLTVAGLVVAATAPPPDPDYKLVRTVVDVLGEVDRSYVRELTPEEKQELVEHMINGGLERLDRHSQYFGEKEYAQFKTEAEGQFGGIGVMITKDPKTGILKVESPMPDTPAYDAGLLAGDLIVKVNGKLTETMTQEDLRQQIKGEVGTEVTLTILREGRREPFDQPLKRALIQIAAVKGFARTAADPTKWDWLADPADKIALIRLLGFSENTEKQLRDAITQADAAGARALVLDLRDNPGGLLKQAGTVTNLFIPSGAIVSTVDKRGAADKKPNRTLTASPANVLLGANKPMAVLVNRQSASAAEIVAAALQDHGRAVVVGERSYGKGSVQKLIEFNNGASALKLTTEVWMTPNGKNLHRWPDSKETDEWGVKPDAGLEVKLTDTERLAYVRHVQSLDRVRGKPGGAPAAAPKDDAAKYKDPVLEKALGHLRAKLNAPAPA